MRIENADLALIAWAKSVLGTPFVWGQTNCVALALDALGVQSGTNVLEKYKRHMDSEWRALACVKKHGFDCITGWFIADGYCVIDPAFIQVGDVAFVRMEKNIGSAVYLGKNYLSSSSELGVVQRGVEQLQTPDLILGVR